MVSALARPIILTAVCQLSQTTSEIYELCDNKLIAPTVFHAVTRCLLTLLVTQAVADQRPLSHLHVQGAEADEAVVLHQTHQGLVEAAVPCKERVVTEVVQQQGQVQHLGVVLQGESWGRGGKGRGSDKCIILVY